MSIKRNKSVRHMVVWMWTAPLLLMTFAAIVAKGQSAEVVIADEEGNTLKLSTIISQVTDTFLYPDDNGMVLMEFGSCYEIHHLAYHSRVYCSDGVEDTIYLKSDKLPLPKLTINANRYREKSYFIGPKQKYKRRVQFAGSVRGAYMLEIPNDDRVDVLLRSIRLNLEVISDHVDFSLRLLRRDSCGCNQSQYLSQSIHFNKKDYQERFDISRESISLPEGGLCIFLDWTVNDYGLSLDECVLFEMRLSRNKKLFKYKSEWLVGPNLSTRYPSHVEWDDISYIGTPIFNIEVSEKVR